MFIWIKPFCDEILWTLWCWDSNIMGELGQWYGNWCPGPWRRQVINSYGITYAGYTLCRIYGPEYQNFEMVKNRNHFQNPKVEYRSNFQANELIVPWDIWMKF